MFKRTLSTTAFTLAALAIFIIAPSAAHAGTIDATKIPKTAAKTINFIPAGWSLEQQIKGDVTGDGVPDYILTLMEDKPASLKGDDFYEKDRALIVIAQDEAGKLTLAGVGGKALQCGTCGGAFWGVIEAPADVKIGDTGTIVISQESGSNTVSSSTLTLRYDPASKKFLLIGYDYDYRDRNTGDYSTESINYATGDRIVKGIKKKKNISAKTKVAKTRIFLEDVDYEKLDEEAGNRLGLN